MNSNYLKIQFISSFISTFIVFALNSLVVDILKLPSYGVSLLTFSAFIPFLILVLHSGSLADRLSLRVISLYSSFSLVSSCIIFYMLYSSSILNVNFLIIPICLLAFISSSSSLFIDASLSSLIPRISIREEISKKNSQLFFCKTLGVLIGSIIAGAAFTYTKINIVFFFMIATSFVLMLVSFKNNDKNIYSKHEHRNVLSYLAFPFKIRTIKIMLFHGVMNNYASAMIDTSIYLLFYNVYHLSAIQIAYIFISRRIGAVCSSKFFSTIKYKNNKYVLFRVSLINGLLWCWIAHLSASLISLKIITIIFFIGFGSTILNIIMSTFRQNSVDLSDQGKVLGAVRFYLFLFYPVGVLTAFILQRLISVNMVFLISGVIISLSSLIVLFLKDIEVIDADS